jgi:16S rRNA (adenine1518-N6/adenine1519-N6)-dimethyltransferase
VDAPDLSRLPPLREVVRAHGLDARKALGQHFLQDPGILARLAAAAGDLAGKTVIEIGPGPGGLTRALLARGPARLIAIERDRRCVEALAGLASAAGGRLEVILADALEVDEAALAPPPFVLVGNLPYNIATALLLKWLRHVGYFESMTLMFQREVADRLVALPGDPAYGRLSVVTRWLCEPKRLFHLPAAAFVPPPKVDSTLVRLLPRAAPLAPAEPEALERVVAAAFGQRRKMLRSSLKALGGDSRALLAAAGIDPERRAETLSVEEFCRLARIWQEAAARQPVP